MSKMRVYEYAKQNNVSSKDIIHKLKEMNIEVSNHMATLEPEVVEKLNHTYKKNEEKQKKRGKRNAKCSGEAKRDHSRF
jgi:translation initiation factor IF-2